MLILLNQQEKKKSCTNLVAGGGWVGRHAYTKGVCVHARARAREREREREKSESLTNTCQCHTTRLKNAVDQHPDVDVPKYEEELAKVLDRKDVRGHQEG